MEYLSLEHLLEKKKLQKLDILQSQLFAVCIFWIAGEINEGKEA